jgi:membrane fusion protein, multidrug efflux system
MRHWRPSASLLLFVVLLLGAVAWIASGMFGRPAAEVPVAQTRRPIVVAATWSQARPVERRLTLYGEILPNQRVIVRAQTSGEIVRVLAPLGALVTPGMPLAQLALGDREARLKRAEAQVAAVQRDLSAARQLARQGFVADTRVQAVTAELQTALAALETIRVEIENTTLRAPIKAALSTWIAEIGSFVAVGGEVVELIDNDPLLAVVQVPQHSIALVTPGGNARVSIVGREPVAGRIRFVAPQANAATRTFRVEIEVPNPDLSLFSGVSAQVVIPSESVLAHQISPAIISLDDRGVPGVYTVAEDGRLAFHPIELVRAEAAGVWVTGVPERARVVTVRPGFIAAGQPVEVRETPPDYGAVLTPARE